MKQIPSKKPNSAPLRTQGGSFIQVPATLSTHCTHPPHAPTSQPRTLKAKQFYGKNPNSATQGIQGGSSIRVPSTINTHTTHPPHAPTFGPSTRHQDAPTPAPRNQAPRAHAPKPSTQGEPTPAPRTQALSAPAPEPTTQPSIEVEYDGNGEDEDEEEEDEVIRTQVQNARRKGTWHVDIAGQLPPDLTMFQTTPVSDEGSAHPTNPTNDATHSPTNLEPEE